MSYYELIHEEFRDWLDSFEPDCPKKCPEDFDEVSHSDDILPPNYCGQLDIPACSTYAQAIAYLRGREVEV